MSIKDKYVVKVIPSEITKDWLLNKHYAHRIPSISYAFGLYSEELEGVLTVGKPASPSLCVGVCGVSNSNYVYELNRLVVNDGLEKNVLSYFVGQCLGLLPKMILVSYADTKHFHTGYIYQATNWIYTGKTKERTDIGTNGKHSRHYDKNGDYRLNREPRSSKHRYIYFIGSKKDKKRWKSELKYKEYPYPKGDNTRYDASYKPDTQASLF